MSLTGKMSLLEMAAIKGWVDVCKELIEKCPIITSSTSLKDRDGNLVTRSPLHYAARAGHLGVVQYLTNNCEVDIDEGKGLTPLALAIEFGHVEVVKYLVSTCKSDW